MNGLESWIGVTNDFWSRGRPTREVGSGIALFAVQMEIHVDAARKKSKNFSKWGFETYCSIIAIYHAFGDLTYNAYLFVGMVAIERKRKIRKSSA